MINQEQNFFPKKLLQLITNLAFVGIERGYFKEAQQIFEAVSLATPQDLNIKIAQAVGELMMGQLSNAAKILLGVLKLDPNNESVKGFLALAFKMANIDNKAVMLSEHILRTCKDKSVLMIAQDILNSYQKTTTLQELQAEQSKRINRKLYVLRQ